MSTAKVGAYLPRLRRGSTTSAASSNSQESKTKDRSYKKPRSKDINSIHSGNGNGNGNEDSSVGNADGDDESSVVYLGGGSGVVVPHTGASKSNNRNDAHQNNIQYRRCCFFWTCCCKCSCLNVRHTPSEPNGGSHLDPLPHENEPPPTIEDIRAWGESFDKLMKMSVGRQAFREFLKCEYSDENILFWQACEDLKREKDPALIEEKARVIYEDYISILSPKEVSLDSRVREIINRNMIEPSPNTFDEAQAQIYTLMHRDSYPRFINSPHYKRLAQLNNNDSSTDVKKDRACKKEGTS